jgi:hypothetical protein
MEIYRQFPNARIKGFAVVARGQDKSANAKLLYGGVSKDHLLIVVDSNSNDSCQIGLIVYTNMENPEVVSVEPWSYRMQRKWMG